MVYVNIHTSKHLKEELACAIDKRLGLIIDAMSVIPLRTEE